MPIKSLFARHPGALALRGVVALTFGLVAFLVPGMAVGTLVLLFGLYVLIDGIAAVVVGTRQHARERAWAVWLEGFAGVGLGLAALLWIRTSAPVVVVPIAVWAIGTGLLELFAAIRLGSELPGEALVAVGGVTSMLLGFTILVRPSAAVSDLAALLGSYTLLFGSAMLATAFRARRAMRRLEKDHTAPAATTATPPKASR